MSEKLPVDLEGFVAQAKQPRYNLRPRISCRPQELPSYQESRRRVKQDMEKNLSEPDKKFGSNLDKKLFLDSVTLTDLHEALINP